MHAKSIKEYLNKDKLNIFLIGIKDLQKKLMTESEIVVQFRLFKSDFDAKLYNILGETGKNHMVKQFLQTKKNEYKNHLQKKKLLVLDKNEIKPNFLDYDILTLIVWIENVNVNEIWLKKENKYYYLLLLYQNEKNSELKKAILLKLLKKIQAYYYYKYK